MRKATEQGFTLIELVVAMAVFSFMLLIVAVGFMNVVRMHNMALASNATQDNVRTAMGELVRAVRDSSEVLSVTGGPNGELCLARSGSQEQVFYIVVSPASSSNRQLYKADDCALKQNPVAITSNVVRIVDFSPKKETSGPKVTKAHVSLKLTGSSNNGTTSVVSGATECTNNNSSRMFCSVFTLNSGAVPR